jgi:hypothetical protein
MRESIWTSKHEGSRKMSHLVKRVEAEKAQAKLFKPRRLSVTRKDQRKAIYLQMAKAVLVWTTI